MSTIKTKITSLSLLAGALLAATGIVSTVAAQETNTLEAIGAVRMLSPKQLESARVYLENATREYEEHQVNIKNAMVR